MRFLLILALFAMLAAPAMALSNSTDVCIDSNTSYHYDYVYNGTDSTVLSNTLIPTKCAFGCDDFTGICKSYDIQSSGIAAIAILIIALIFSIIATKVSSGIVVGGQDVEILQPLLFAISLYMSLTAIVMMLTGAQGTSLYALYTQLQTGYGIVLYTLVFFLLFMAISFLYGTMKKAGKKA